jgi:hypothetical protein
MSSATVGRGYDTSTEYDQTEVAGSGWVMFAAVLLFFAGIWNLIDGILAISSSHVYTANAHFVFSDLRTWGWIIAVLGILQLAAGASVMSGSEIARWFAVAVAALNAIGQLLFLTAYPFWALSMFTVDLLVIYGLAVYGGSRLRQA